MRSVRFRLAPAVAGLLLFASAQAAAQLPAIQSATYVGGLSCAGRHGAGSVRSGGAVRRRAGRAHPGRSANGALQAHRFPRPARRRSRAAASAACSAWRSRPTTRRAAGSSSISPSATATPSSRDSGGRRQSARRRSGVALRPALVARPARARHPRSRSRNHNGGNLAFGPDGYLYIGMGDGGSGDDPQQPRAEPGTLLGKMLRIDVDVPDSDRARLPSPGRQPVRRRRPGGGAPRDLGFGLRNPWRFSFDDPARGGTGALVIGDVGQNALEEIDYEPAGRGGRNYGWRNREGAHDNVTSRAAGVRAAGRSDLRVRPRASGRSITGGYVYRGTRARRGVPRPLLLRRLHLAAASGRSR